MLLFWMDRADSLSGVARHLERRVSGNAEALRLTPLQPAGLGLA